MPWFVFCDMTLTQQDIDNIAEVLGKPEQPDDKSWFWNLREEKHGRVLALTVTHVPLGGQGDKGTGGQGQEGDQEFAVVASAQTHQGYVELHDITGYLIIEPDEIMFVAKQGDRFSSLVVGKSCTCSQFGNIQASLLQGDLAELDPALLMAAMQSSLAESLVETSGS